MKKLESVCHITPYSADIKVSLVLWHCYQNHPNQMCSPNCWQISCESLSVREKCTKQHYPFDSFISNSVVYLTVSQEFGLCAQGNLSGDKFWVLWQKFEFLELQNWGKGLNQSWLLQGRITLLNLIWFSYIITLLNCQSKKAS